MITKPEFPFLLIREIGLAKIAKNPQYIIWMIILTLSSTRCKKGSTKIQ
jgi:hypothetical protein